MPADNRTAADDQTRLQHDREQTMAAAHQASTLIVGFFHGLLLELAAQEPNLLPSERLTVATTLTGHYVTTVFGRGPTPTRP